MVIYLKDSAATEALGRLLGKHAASGDVFCLSGDLGAGKTLLSRGSSCGGRQQSDLCYHECLSGV